MKQIFALIVLVLGFSLSLQAKKMEGSIVFANGEEKQVTLLIPTAFMSNMPNFEKMATRIKYLDEQGKTHKVRPDDAREVRFTYEGEQVRMVSCPDKLNLSPFYSSAKNVFLVLIKDGRLKLFQYFETVSSSNGMGGVNMNQQKGYLMQKGNGEMYKPSFWSFQKSMAEYLSDCPELSTRIANGEFSKSDIQLIVESYNSDCK
jgi:hypothetical protein